MPERTASIRNQTISWWRICSKIATSSPLPGAGEVSRELVSTCGACTTCEVGGEATWECEPADDCAGAACLTTACGVGGTGGMGCNRSGAADGGVGIETGVATLSGVATFATGGSGALAIAGAFTAGVSTVAIVISGLRPLAAGTEVEAGTGVRAGELPGCEVLRYTSVAGLFGTGGRTSPRDPFAWEPFV